MVRSGDFIRGNSVPDSAIGGGGKEGRSEAYDQAKPPDSYYEGWARGCR